MSSLRKQEDKTGGFGARPTVNVLPTYRDTTLNRFVCIGPDITPEIHDLQTLGFFPPKSIYYNNINSERYLSGTWS